ncbi:MAG: tripartite tricarboxylate transporter substrate binding protein [Burkholderiales bacterium]|nr:tripartite tricarboxylate transporter substrate binding protein [Burkholderiales bacterium]
MFSARVFLAIVAIAFAISPPSANAQAWPAKQVSIVVSYPPGQSIDIVARLIASRLAPALGVPVLVDNRPGAGGTIGTGQVARSAPDGYTLLFASPGPITVSPALRPTELRYDPVKDFELVNVMATIAQVFMVNPSFPVNNIADLIALAKKQPGNISFASSGIGSTQHLLMEMFASKAGIKLNHVPYKGSSPATIDLVGGRIPLMSDVMSIAEPLVKSGKARAIAVSSIKRQPLLPNVPTLDEQGITGFNETSWYAILAPTGTPAAVLDRLSAEIAKVIEEPEIKNRLKDMGLVLKTETRKDVDWPKFIHADIEKLRKIVAEANIKME